MPLGESTTFGAPSASRSAPESPSTAAWLRAKPRATEAGEPAADPLSVPVRFWRERGVPVSASSCSFPPAPRRRSSAARADRTCDPAARDALWTLRTLARSALRES